MLSGKTLKKLVIITSICMVPVIVLSIKNNTSNIKNKNALLLPDLLQKPDQISKIVLQDNRQTLTLQKKDDVWMAIERNNYPILSSRVQELLQSLANLRIVEPKTTNPEFYKQLDVGDVRSEDSQALLISVQDVYNDHLANLYIGKREGVRLGEEYQEHIFVRKAGDNQAWLVRGTIPYANDISDWTEQPLLSLVEGDQIKRVEIKHGNNKIVIAKDAKEQEDFILETVHPVQGKVLDLDAVNTVPFELAELEFTDVVPITNVDWSQGLVATVETFPGITLTVNVAKDNQRVLAKVVASTSAHASEELQKSVASFNQSKQGWLYQVEPEIFKELSLSSEDFYKVKEPEVKEKA